MQQGMGVFYYCYFYFFRQNYSLKFNQTLTQIFMCEFQLGIKIFIQFSKHMSLVQALYI